MNDLLHDTTATTAAAAVADGGDLFVRFAVGLHLVLHRLLEHPQFQHFAVLRQSRINSDRVGSGWDSFTATATAIVVAKCEDQGCAVVAAVAKRKGRWLVGGFFLVLFRQLCLFLFPCFLFLVVGGLKQKK